MFGGVAIRREGCVWSDTAKDEMYNDERERSVRIGEKSRAEK